MDRELARYLDGITALLSLLTGVMAASLVSASFDATFVAGLGFGCLLYCLVFAYQRDLFGDGSATRENA